jgi:histidinol-phosphatase (PHP family)
VLTDYHVHLRPDEADTPSERYFTPANAERYREAASERGIEELGVSEHIHRFTAALDIWQHPFWRGQARDDLERYVEFVREETDLRLGIEMDYVEGREGQIANVLDRHDWDYVIGSVHFLRQEAVDMRGEFDVWGLGERPERVWARYFETLQHAALSGLYDLMAHPDLVKVWGVRPEIDLRRYYEPTVEAFLEAGVVVEVSTAGLRKPVGEIYPARGFLEMVVDAGLPIALSSDAHTPEHLGFGYEEAVALLSEIGITELTVFEGRERRTEAIG